MSPESRGIETKAKVAAGMSCRESGRSLEGYRGAGTVEEHLVGLAEQRCEVGAIECLQELDEAACGDVEFQTVRRSPDRCLRDVAQSCEHPPRESLPVIGRGGSPRRRREIREAAGEETCPRPGDQVREDLHDPVMLQSKVVPECLLEEQDGPELTTAEPLRRGLGLREVGERVGRDLATGHPEQRADCTDGAQVLPEQVDRRDMSGRPFEPDVVRRGCVGDLG